jgi:hypothetical protein
LERHPHRLYLEYQGDSIELPPGETVIGRDIGCAFRLNDPLVSRRHLRFVRRADEAFVEDLGSRNGTLVNGRALVKPLHLHDGDVIALGGRKLVVRIVGDDEELAATLVLAQLAAGEFDDDTIRVPSIASRLTLPIPVVTAIQAAEPSVPIDRRRHDRVQAELPLVYVSEELEIEATALDLSHGGVFVQTQILDPVGTECRLTILLDGGPPLHLTGVVRRVVAHNDRGEPVGLGIELTSTGPAAATWIDLVAARQV